MVLEVRKVSRTTCGIPLGQHSFNTGEAHCGDREVAGDLAESDPCVEGERSPVAGVGEEPDMAGSPLLEPRKPGHRQCLSDPSVH